MSEVPWQEAGAAVVGVRGVGKGVFESGTGGRTLRVVWRSAGAGGLLDAGYELGLGFDSIHTQGTEFLREKQTSAAKARLSAASQGTSKLVPLPFLVLLHFAA